MAIIWHESTRRETPYRASDKKEVICMAIFNHPWFLWLTGGP